MFTAICKRIGVWGVQKDRLYLLLGVLCLLGSVTLTANAILTVSNSGMFGDADVTVDSAGTLNVGTASSNPGSSQWLNGTSGTIFYSSGSIGINTTTPLALLSIVGSATSTAPLFDIASSSGTSLFRVSPNGTVTVGTTVSDPVNGIVSPTVPHVILSVEGDSISAPVSQGAPVGTLAWPYQLGTLGGPLAAARLYNWALGSDTCALMVGEYATQAHMVAPVNANDVGYFALRCGINDLSASVPAATIYANIKTIWASARADGYRVVAFTISGSSVTSATALNTLILSDQSQYDYLVRDDLVIPNMSDTYLTTSGLHVLPAGSLRTAKAFVDALSQPPTRRGAELVSNPSFEMAGSPTWYWWAGGTGGIDTTVSSEVHSGNHAAKVVSGVDVTTASITTVPGAAYTLSFWTRGDGTHGGQYYCYDSTHGSYIFTLAQTGVTSTTYSYISVPFTAAAGTLSVFCDFQGPVSSGTAWYDDVSLRPLISGVSTQ